MQKLNTIVYCLVGKDAKMFVTSGAVIETNATGANIMLLSGKIAFVANEDMFTNEHSATKAYDKAQEAK